ncbi:hypothetical protein LJR267_009050 [Paraburkholderia hospita]|jgi:hypothetical protein|nr:hypothetical protein [Paraburkholderia hospita]OUL95949.1 hypothetical protein CA601_03770 [Paraburkholderia hospita]
MPLDILDDDDPEFHYYSEQGKIIDGPAKSKKTANVQSGDTGIARTAYTAPITGIVIMQTDSACSSIDQDPT